MTAQVSDSFELDGKIYSVAGVNGDELFNPTAYDLQPMVLSTACWRGFICTYGLADDQLLLTRLVIGIAKPGTDERLVEEEGPERFGVRGRWSDGRDPHDYGPITAHHVYEPIAEPLRFTGGLLVARDFINELYVHMGFHPAWKYREVHELLFDGGRLQARHDRSEALARIRERLVTAPLRPDAGDPEVKTWIKESFSLTYSYRW